MITIDESLSWAVLAPLPAAELEQIAAQEWKKAFPYSDDPPPWEVTAGSGAYTALVCSEPGAEGSDWPFAEMASRKAPGKTVYSLWLDPEYEEVFTWQNGERSGSLIIDPLDLAESLGFQVGRPAPQPRGYSLAVVEGAAVEAVRQALGEIANEGWLDITTSPLGTLITAKDGRIGTQAWDASEALPDATVYYVQRWPENNRFSVLTMRGGEEVSVFNSELEDETLHAPVKGQREPGAILRALGIPPERLGL